MKWWPWRKPTETLEGRAAAARQRARDLERDAVVAKADARTAAREAAALASQSRFEKWKRLQEDAGYTVVGDSMKTARVVELPDGPTYDERPRG